MYLFTNMSNLRTGTHYFSFNKLQDVASFKVNLFSSIVRSPKLRAHWL